MKEWGGWVSVNEVVHNAAEVVKYVVDVIRNGRVIADVVVKAETDDVSNAKE